MLLVEYIHEKKKLDQALILDPPKNRLSFADVPTFSAYCSLFLTFFYVVNIH